MHDGHDAFPDGSRAEVDGVAFSWRPGCRGHPDPPAGWRPLVRAARAAHGDVLDASACLGVPGRAVTDGRVTVLEPSWIALDALRRDLGASRSAADPSDADRLEARAGLVWDAPRGAFDAVLIAPPAERGSARVRAEIDAAARALRPGGTAWILLEKGRGAARYERDAAVRFARGDVTDRVAGFRLSRWTGPRPVDAPAEGPSAPPTEDDPGGDDAPWLRFDVDGAPAWALPGVYAAGKLDPGTATLLAALEADGPDLAGTRVLDLGCGWGPLTRYALAGGATVTAVDDDLAAVRSARRTAPGADVRHGDLDACFAAGERFDVVLVNPPFHVGAGVRLGVGRRFLEAAARRGAPGGEAWIVANAALPYEATLDATGALSEVTRGRGFKVLRWRPRTRR